MQRFLIPLTLMWSVGFGCGVAPTEEVAAPGPEVQVPASPTPEETPGDDPTAPSSPPDLSTLDLYGTLPPSPLPAPTFHATNRDGTSRGQAALIGQPTVLWFFPAAGTAG